MRSGIIYSKVVGVSFPNDDGSSRQRIIKSFCRKGATLVARREPRNKYDRNAIGLWVRFGSDLYQIGYVQSDLAARLAEWLREGGDIRVTVAEVTGGGLFFRRTRGVNVAIEYGPAKAEVRPAEAEPAIPSVGESRPNRSRLAEGPGWGCTLVFAAVVALLFWLTSR